MKGGGMEDDRGRRGRNERGREGSCLQEGLKSEAVTPVVPKRGQWASQVATVFGKGSHISRYFVGLVAIGLVRP